MKREAAIPGLLFAGLAGVGLALSSGAPLSAQELLRPEPRTAGPTADGAIRVVERFDPAAGTRTREVVARPSPAEILRVQRALQREGHPVAGARGELDAATRQALRRFQRERGLEPCGCVSYETVLALGLSPVVVQTVLAGPAADAGADAAASVEVFYPKAGSEEGAAPGAPGTGGAAGAGEEITLSRAELETLIGAVESARRDTWPATATFAGTPFLPHFLLPHLALLEPLDAVSLRLLLQRLREEGLLGPEGGTASSEPLGRGRDRERSMRTRPAPPGRPAPPPRLSPP